MPAFASSHALRRLAAALCIAASLASAHAAPADETLFDALGGQPGIALLMDDFVPRLGSDARIGHFFKRSDLVELKRLLALQVCAVAGGPCVYDGATMQKAHAGLAIGKGDFLRMVELMQFAMDARAIPFAAQNRLLARLAPMHRDVIER